MQHCLVMPKYQTSESVVVLKANHDMQYGGRYAFSTVKVGKSNFSIHPCILEDEPTLWFHVEDEFCILCAAYKKDQVSTVDSKPSNPHTLSVPQQSKPLPPSPPSSPSHGAATAAAQPNKPESEIPTHHLSSRNSPYASHNVKKDSIRNHQKRKLSPASYWEDAAMAKKTCHLELIILLMEPKIKTSYYTTSVYVCQNCYVSIEVGLYSLYFVMLIKLTVLGMQETSTEQLWTCKC